MNGPLFQPKIGSILYATDLSPIAGRALGYALSLADVYNAEITVLHVFGKVPPNADLLLAAIEGYAGIEELRQQSENLMKEHIRSRLEALCAESANHVPACRFIVRDVIVETGNVPKRILHHARSGGYDALVMGSGGYGPIQALIRGGTTYRVLRDCPIPVIAVPVAGRLMNGEHSNTTGATDQANAE